MMRSEMTNRRFRLRLLALILALLLLWYSINPAPYTVVRDKRKETEPDAKKRQAAPVINHIPHSLLFHRPHVQESSDVLISIDAETDDFDWPEYIDG